MSQLQLATATKMFKLNVTAFESPMYEQISSCQTKRMAVHFPIRITQPDIQFSVCFRNEREFEDFQAAVRVSQQNALSRAGLVTLFWPERSIINWTGVIKRFVAGGQRFNVMPTAAFRVHLVDSLVTSRTENGSLAANWQSIYGFGMMGNAVLQLPSAAEAQQILTEFGQNIYNSGQQIVNQLNSTVSGILRGTG